MAIKELWFGSGASSQDGTYANPITSYSTFRSAILTFGSLGLDLRIKAGSKWVGPVPDEHGTYNNVTVRGEADSSNLGIIDGGRRVTDWSENTSVSATGKKIWQKTLSYTSNGNSASEPGNVSIDDEVLACVHWLSGGLQTTVTEMAKFGSAFSWNKTGTMYLVLPSGDNPNSLLTEVSQDHIGLRNAWPSAGEFTGTVTGAVYQDLVIKRFSIHGMMPRNQPGIITRRIHLKHIGGAWRGSQSFWYGNGIEWDGGCDDLLCEDIVGEGIEDSLLSPQISSSGNTQDNLTIRRVEGHHVGLAVVELVQQVSNASTDGVLMEDIVGWDIGRNKTSSKRESVNGGTYAGLDGKFRCGYMVAHNQNSGATNSVMNNFTMRRVKSFDAPLAWLNMRGPAATHRFEGCVAFLDGSTARLDHAISVGRNLNAATDSVTVESCVFKGFVDAVGFSPNSGDSDKLLRVTGYHNTIVDCSNGFNGKSKSGARLTIQNNVVQDCSNAVANFGGSAVTTQGGNWIATGTNAGFTSGTNDQTGQAKISFEVGGYCKPVNGSAVYSGGVTRSGAGVDQLGQTYPTSGVIARGAYAGYSSSNSNVVEPGVIGGGGGEPLPPLNLSVPASARMFEYFRAVVTDGEGDAVSGATVAFTVGGTGQVIATTNASGVAVCRALATGTLAMQATAGEDVAAASIAISAADTTVNKSPASDDITAAAWELEGTGNSRTANNVADVYGTTTWDTFTQGTGTPALNTVYTALATTGRKTVSRFLKRGSHDWVSLRLYAGAPGDNKYGTAWFNLATGAAGSTQVVGAVSNMTSGIEDWGGGIYRCWVSLEADTAGGMQAQLRIDSGNYGFSFPNGASVGIGGDMIQNGALALFQNTALTFAPVIAAKTLAIATQGALYSDSITCSGTPPITWSITDGSLPAGLSADTGQTSNTLTITGTPSGTTDAAIEVTAQNAQGSDTEDFTIPLAALSAPDAPTIATVNSDTLSVAVAAIDSDAIDLNVWLRKTAPVADADFTLAGSYPKGDFPIEVTDLQVGATYEVKVQAENADTVSELSDASATTTLHRLFVYAHLEPDAAGVTGLQVQAGSIPPAGHVFPVDTYGQNSTEQFDIATVTYAGKTQSRITLQLSEQPAAKIRHGSYACMAAFKVMGAGSVYQTPIMYDAIVVEGP